MPLMATYDEVGDGANALKIRGGSMVTKMVYGNDCNLMLAIRGPGYHSNPHKHDAEQLNYVLEGEIWVFIDDDGFLAKKGDFCRIPRNALHWAWNRSNADCTVLEIGTRLAQDGAYYSDIDMMAPAGGQPAEYCHRDGTPYPKQERRGA